MRLGVSLYVPAGFRTDPEICAEPRAVGALSDRRPSRIPALAGALFPGVLAGTDAAQRDGGIAADPPQPDRARRADDGGQGAGAAAAVRLDKTVSLRCHARQCRARLRTRQAIWRHG